MPQAEASAKAMPTLRQRDASLERVEGLTSENAQLRATIDRLIDAGEGNLALANAAGERSCGSENAGRKGVRATITLSRNCGA